MQRILLLALLFLPSLMWAQQIRPIGDAAPLSTRGTQNVVAFARLLGYLRYFHPAEEALRVDWDSLAVEGMRRVEDSPDAERLAHILRSLFASVAPAVQIIAASEEKSPSTPLNTLAGGGMLHWRHRGLSWGMENQYRGEGAYRSDLVIAPVVGGVLPDSVPDPRKTFRADLGGGVVASIPLSRFVPLPNDSSERVRSPEAAEAKSAYTAEDRAVRLAAVATAWNVPQHFYPYFDVVEVDWSAELPRALKAAATDRDAQMLLSTLQGMVAALQDGHGDVSYGDLSLRRLPPVRLDWVEDAVVVTAVATGMEEIRPGDVVLRINGRPAHNVVEELEGRSSGATPQWRRYLALRSLHFGPEGSALRLEVKSPAGETRTVVLQRTLTQKQAPTEARPEPIAEVHPGIFYVDLARATDEEFRSALPRLATARGLVFDLRGYPSLAADEVLEHLMRVPGTSAQWHYPIVTRPDRLGMRFHREGEWELKPREPHLSAPRVFLTDGRAISAAESILGIVEHYRLGEILGGPTAGTNGGVNPFRVPGGYTVRWTGMRVLKHDGSRHHGIGIQPTVPVFRTIRGLAEGQDELLQAALERLDRRWSSGR